MVWSQVDFSSIIEGYFLGTGAMEWLQQTLVKQPWGIWTNECMTLPHYHIIITMKTKLNAEIPLAAKISIWHQIVNTSWRLSAPTPQKWRWVTVTLSWHAQNLVVISWAHHFKLEQCKFLSDFKFDQNIVSGTGSRSGCDLQGNWGHFSFDKECFHECAFKS